MSDVSFGRRPKGPQDPKTPPRANDNARVDPALERAANDFQSDAAAIEEAPVPISAHAALLVLLLLLATAVFWAVVGTVDRIVVAPGKIATSTPMLVMQPFTTSKVVEIAVKAGDHVKKGQLLARFDSSFAQADVASLQQKVTSLSAETERLEAQLTGKSFVAREGDTPERLTQAQIFAQEANDYQAEMDQRESRLAAIDAQIRVDDTAMPGIQQQLNMAQRVVEMYTRLQREKAAATLDIMKSQSSLIDSQLRLRNTQGDRDKQVAARSETLQERQAFLQKWRGDHNKAMVEARQKLAEAAETLNKANRMHDLTEISAPFDAVVQDVAQRSIGSVMREAETLVTLIPDNADLYVEADVPARDIGYLSVGDTVRVKLESYPFQRFGTATGTLSIINPDSTQVDEKDPTRRIYHVQVKLTERPGALVRRNIHLKPGLVASAEIKTGTRTIASYVLNPVLRITDESLREP